MKYQTSGRPFGKKRSNNETMSHWLFIGEFVGDEIYECSTHGSGYYVINYYSMIPMNSQDSMESKCFFEAQLMIFTLKILPIDLRLNPLR